MFYKTQCQFLAQKKEPTTGDVAWGKGVCCISVQSGTRSVRVTRALTFVSGIEVTDGAHNSDRFSALLCSTSFSWFGP